MGGASALPGFESDPATRLTPSLPFAQVAPAHAAAPPSFSSPMQQMAAPMAGGNSWATDFSRFAAQQRSPAPTTLASRQMNHSPAQTTFQPSFSQPNFSSAFAPSMFSPPTVAAKEPEFDQEMSRWMSAHGGGNMTEVDAAMEQMALELEETEAIAAAVKASRLTDLDTPEIGNLALSDDARVLEAQPEPLLEQIQEPEPEREQVDVQHSKSAVAEAAEKLLDCVKHESGEKWQNSIFLSLMRDFRDGRKDIVGDEIRSTTGETAAPAAQPVAT